MMTLDNKSLDTLTLDSAKKHLVVGHNLDDPLIEGYLKASLDVAERYINRPITSESYSSQKSSNNTYEIKYKPSEVYLYQGTTLIGQIPFDYSYPQLTLQLDGTEVFDTVKADIQGSNSESINQARLLMVGSSYKTRENEDFSNMKATDLSVKFLLDLNTKRSIL
jgi:hypothetical protein